MKNSGPVILGVQVTEKSTALSEKAGRYFFRVATWANKVQIRRAVEDAFKVSVAAVNTMNYRGKKKRNRRSQYGETPSWKRAVVTLKEGSRIDLTT